MATIIDTEEEAKKKRGSAMGAFAHNAMESALFIPKLVVTGIEKGANNSGMTSDDFHQRIQDANNDTLAVLDSDPEERQANMQARAERDADHPFASISGSIAGGFADPTNFIPGIGMANIASRAGGSVASAMGKAALKDAAMNVGYGLAGQAVDDKREFLDSTPEDAAFGAGFGAGFAGGGRLLKTVKAPFVATINKV